LGVSIGDWKSVVKYFGSTEDVQTRHKHFATIIHGKSSSDRATAFQQTFCDENKMTYRKERHLTGERRNQHEFVYNIFMRAQHEAFLSLKKALGRAGSKVLKYIRPQGPEGGIVSKETSGRLNYHVVDLIDMMADSDEQARKKRKVVKRVQQLLDENEITVDRLDCWLTSALFHQPLSASHSPGSETTVPSAGGDSGDEIETWKQPAIEDIST
jgi:hypothetical protein